MSTRPPYACEHTQEICFYNIPTDKESKAGAQPELLKSFPSGHEELVTKILLLDVDRVGRYCTYKRLTWGNRLAWFDA